MSLLDRMLGLEEEEMEEMELEEDFTWDLPSREEREKELSKASVTEGVLASLGIENAREEKERKRKRKRGKETNAEKAENELRSRYFSTGDATKVIESSTFEDMCDDLSLTQGGRHGGEEGFTIELDLAEDDNVQKKKRKRATPATKRATKAEKDLHASFHQFHLLCYVAHFRHILHSILEESFYQSMVLSMLSDEEVINCFRYLSPRLRKNGKRKKGTRGVKKSIGGVSAQFVTCQELLKWIHGRWDVCGALEPPRSGVEAAERLTGKALSLKEANWLLYMLIVLFRESFTNVDSHENPLKTQGKRRVTKKKQKGKSDKANGGEDEEDEELEDILTEELLQGWSRVYHFAGVRLVTVVRPTPWQVPETPDQKKGLEREKGITVRITDRGVLKNPQVVGADRDMIAEVRKDVEKKKKEKGEKGKKKSSKPRRQNTSTPRKSIRKKAGASGAVEEVSDEELTSRSRIQDRKRATESASKTTESERENSQESEPFVDGNSGDDSDFQSSPILSGSVGKKRVSDIGYSQKRKREKRATGDMGGRGSHDKAVTLILSDDEETGTDDEETGTQERDNKEKGEEDDLVEVLLTTSSTAGVASSYFSGQSVVNGGQRGGSEALVPVLEWVEVFDEERGKWLAVDVRNGIVGKPLHFEEVIHNTNRELVEAARVHSQAAKKRRGGKKSLSIKEEEEVASRNEGDNSDNDEEDTGVIMEQIDVSAFETPSQRFPSFYYVLAWSLASGPCTDVTFRYSNDWVHALRNRLPGTWWKSTQKQLSHGDETSQCFIADEREVEELEGTVRVPKTIAAIKSHPLFVLEENVNKYQAVHPVEEVGRVRDKPVFLRRNLHDLHATEKWIQLGLEVKEGEEPFKYVAARPRPQLTRRKQHIRFQGGQVIEEIEKVPVKMKKQEEEDRKVALYGPWQVKRYQAPPPVDGKVPTNEYGNVYLFHRHMLPPGCVHLDLHGIEKVAKRLGIHAPLAMVGWKHVSGWMSVPELRGAVVIEEVKESLLSAYYKDTLDKAYTKAHKKRQALVLRWRKLARRLLTFEQLRNESGAADDGKLLLSRGTNTSPIKLD